MSQVVRKHPVGPGESLTISLYLKFHARELDLLATEEAATTAERRIGEYADDIAAVVEFASGLSLEVVEIVPEYPMIRVRGTAEQLGTVFAVELAVFTDGEREFIGHSGEPQVPTAIAPLLVGVLGLDRRPRARAGAIQATASAQGRRPSAFGEIYDFPQRVNGRGQTIALINLGPAALRSDDTSAAFEAMGLPVPAIVPIWPPGSPYPFSAGPNDKELALDVQTAGGLAPGATLTLYVSAGTSGTAIADAVHQALNNTTRPPSVMTMSFGGDEQPLTNSYTAVMEQAFSAAVARNISIFAASGDYLAANDWSSNPQTTQAYVSYPASSPSVIGVGGTSYQGAVNEPVWSWAPQGHNFGTGGGVSRTFAVPAFQQSTTLPKHVNTGQPGRGVPDVAANSDPDFGFLIEFNGATVTAGGTSAASPLWAALAARINQQAGSPIGFFLPTLYAHPTLARDTTVGNNFMANTSMGYAAGPGWDACSGLGTPSGNTLATHLTSTTRNATRLAATAWMASGSVQLRVYAQDLKGRIQEFANTGGWTRSTLLPALSETPLAVVHWLDQLRLFSFDDYGDICQSANNSWHTVIVNETPVGKDTLGAIGWNDGVNTNTRVYCQDASNQLVQIANGLPVPAPAPLGFACMPDTRLACVQWTYAGNTEIRLFLQDPSGTVVQGVNGSPFNFAPAAGFDNVLRGTDFAAVQWLDAYQDTQLRVFYQQNDGSLWMATNLSSTPVEVISAGAPHPAVRATALAAAHFNDGRERVRLYYQTSDDIREICEPGTPNQADGVVLSPIA